MYFLFQCVVCGTNKATMQTLPCAHRVIFLLAKEKHIDKCNRVVSPNFGHPALRHLQYNDFLQAKNSFFNNCEWTVSFEVVSAFEW